MARLYADEDFPLPLVEELQRLGHDVRTVQEAGRANQGIDDATILADAIADLRAVLTHNHLDFKRLHRHNLPHELKSSVAKLTVPGSSQERHAF